MYELWPDTSFEQMIQKTSFADRTKDIITDRWYELNEEDEFEYLEKIGIQEKIINNLADPIASGMNYGQNDIKRKLRDMGL